MSCRLGGRAELVVVALACACSGTTLPASSHGDAASGGTQVDGGQATSGGMTAAGGITASGGVTSGAGGARASGGTGNASGAGGMRLSSGGTAGMSSGGTAGTSSGGTAGASSGGAAGAGGNAGACNSLALDGPRVVPVAATGELPTPMGGTIADGRWVMSAYEYYMSTVINPMHATYEIRGGDVQYAFQEETMPLTTATFTMTVDGTQVTKTRTCPAPATQMNGFTATPTEIVFIDTTRRAVWHLTRN